MKSFFKSKKFLIVIIFLLLVALIIMGGLLLKKSNKQIEKENKIVIDYIAYVKINPSIKLQYSQTCNDKNECTNPIVTDYELINGDAKNIYKDIDLTKGGNDLINVLDLITQTAKDNNISFETVEIYSDWKNINEYVEEKNKNNSQNWNYSVKVSNQEELNNVEKKFEENNNSNEDNYQSTGSEINTNNNGSTPNNNQEPVEWTELAPGLYYNGESSGYGDYIKGEHVSTSNGYRWFKFVDTSKLGCKDANDKQACKSYWINFWTPKVAETKKDMDNAKKALDDTKALQERDKKSLEETKIKLQQCENAEINACKPGEYSLRDEMLTELNNQVKNWEEQVESWNISIKEYEKILEGETNDYNEHLRALNIYKSL